MARSDDVQRRRRAVGVLHRLAPAHRAATPEEVAASLVVLHSTDPASVHLAIAARTKGDGASVADVDRALLVDRSIVRLLAMRRTMWAVPAQLVPTVVAAAGLGVAKEERRKVVKALVDNGVTTDPERWLDEAIADTVAALAELVEARPADLAAAVPALKTTIRIGGDSKWAAEVTIASRMVVLLSATGQLVRGRPRGTWTSTQHRYALAPPHADPPSVDVAQADLARLWLASFGASSVDPVVDLKWWTGWTVAATRKALGDIVARGAPNRDPGEWAAVVPALDPSTMGWRDRSWYLDDEVVPQLFDRNGNAGPAIWWCGRVVGGWAHRDTGEVATRLLVDIGRDGTAAVEAETERLQRWLDASGAIIKPRFPTPLQKELRA